MLIVQTLINRYCKALQVSAAVAAADLCSDDNRSDAEEDDDIYVVLFVSVGEMFDLLHPGIRQFHAACFHTDCSGSHEEPRHQDHLLHTRYIYN